MNIFHTGVIFLEISCGRNNHMTTYSLSNVLQTHLCCFPPRCERERDVLVFLLLLLKKKLIFFKCDKDRMIILCRVIVSYVLGWIKLKTYMRGFQVSVIIYLKSHSHCIETQYKMPFVKIKTRTKHWNFGSLNTN